MFQKMKNMETDTALGSLFDIEVQFSGVPEAYWNDFEKRSETYSAEKAYERIHPIIRRFLNIPDVVEYVETEILRSINNYPSCTYTCHNKPVYERLLMRAIAQYYNLRSKCVYSKYGVSKVYIARHRGTITLPKPKLYEYIISNRLY